MTKRVLDFFLALVGLVILLPLIIVVAIAIKLNSTGPIFFRQERIGRGFRPFRIYKFRTMVLDAPRRGSAITYGDDPRITRLGRMLRMTKVDELPQLINVVKGEMSIVGPRPEVREYVERFRQDYEEILAVRPGITDFASLKFRDEAALLGSAADPAAMYLTCILPEKVRLAKQYVRASSLGVDIVLILRTLTALAGFKVT